MKVFNIDVQLTKQEDGLWRASVPGLRGCWVDAETLQQALDEIQEVAAMVIDLLEESHEPLPSSVSKIEADSLGARVPLAISEHHFARKTSRRAKPAIR